MRLKSWVLVSAIVIALASSSGASAVYAASVAAPPSKALSTYFTKLQPHHKRYTAALRCVSAIDFEILRRKTGLIANLRSVGTRIERCTRGPKTISLQAAAVVAPATIRAAHLKLVKSIRLSAPLFDDVASTYWAVADDLDAAFDANDVTALLEALGQATDDIYATNARFSRGLERVDDLLLDWKLAVIQEAARVKVVVPAWAKK